MSTTNEARNDDLTRRLAGFLARELDCPAVEVHDLTRLSGGASRETFSFDLVIPGAGGDGEEVRPLILQRVRPGALSESFSMVGEADLLRAAARSGVPVPEVIAASDEPDVAGSQFVVVTRLPGETIARRILRDEAYAPARGVLVEQCAAALAGIHAIDPASVPTLRVQDPLGQTRSLYDHLDEPHPAFDLAFDWLERHRPVGGGEATEAACVVHGDFRLGNLLVDADGLRAVLDWELAHLGDPVEDLAWFCVKAWRFGEARPVAGLGEYEELIDTYEQRSGRAVDWDAFRWWQLLGTVRWGVICILQARTHLAGHSRSVELAAIGRRVCETELDTLELLPGPFSVAATSVDRDAIDEARGTVEAEPDEPGIHGRPTAAELVEAVREFLASDVMDATDGRVRFHARIAANVLGMVERELRAGTDAEDAHRERLERLGFSSDRELAGAIRAGALADRFDEVKDAVLASVLDKLRVANPGYLLASRTNTTATGSS
jgi:aminoglycoside phosphotransferase (APT) family kinase protein